MMVMRAGGRHAITHYKTLKSYGEQALTLVECKLETGRTHQIRVHLDAQRHSVVGDKVYNTSANRYLRGLDDDLIDLIKNFNRQALHSCSMQFIHPITEMEMLFEKEAPKDMSDLLNKLSYYSD